MLSSYSHDTLFQKEVFYFNWSSLSFLSCIMPLVLKQKSSPCPRSPRFSPSISSRSIIVLHFIFRCVIHLESPFVNGVSPVCIYCSARCPFELFQQLLLKDFGSSLYCLCAFVEWTSVDLCLCESISGPLFFHSSDLFVHSFTNTWHSLDFWAL